MNDKKLRALLTAVQCGSFGKATAQLGYTQSAMTHMVNRLEAELGCTLLVRGSHGVRPVRGGGEAAALHAGSDRRGRRTAPGGGGPGQAATSNTLRIGCFASIARARLPKLLRKFRKIHPEIQVDVLVRGYELACGAGGGTYPAGPGGRGLRQGLLLDTADGRAPGGGGAAGFRLGGGDHLSGAAAAGAVSLLLRSSMWSGCLPQDATRVEVTASDDGAILSMVAGGLGVSVLSAFSLAGYEGQVRVIPLTQPVSRRLGVAVKAPAGCQHSSKICSCRS